MRVRIRYKWWTLDCDRCGCHLDGYCYWGVCVKRLSRLEAGGREPHKARHCEYFGKPPRSRNIPGSIDFKRYEHSVRGLVSDVRGANPQMTLPMIGASNND